MKNWKKEIACEVERITGQKVIEIWDEDIKSVAYVGKDDILAVYNANTGKLKINR